MAKNLKWLGVFLFVIVDLVAIVLAIKHVNQRPDSRPTIPTVAPSATKTTDARANATKPTDLFVTASYISRFAGGTCDRRGTAKLEVAHKDAANFVEVALPINTKAGATGDRSVAVVKILAVTVKSPQEISLIGDDASCSAYRYTSTDGGKNWTQEASIEDWYVENGKVGTPAGVMVDPNCEAMTVSLITNRNARVVCKSGEIRGTDDIGHTWVGLGTLRELTAATFTSLQGGVGAAKDTDCASRVYETDSAGGKWAPLGCIDKNKTATAIGSSSEIMAALVGGNVYVSADQGKTWKKF